jgi:hypothetical protein
MVLEKLMLNIFKQIQLLQKTKPRGFEEPGTTTSILNKLRSGGVAEVIEHLSSKHETLIQIPVLPKWGKSLETCILQICDMLKLVIYCSLHLES